jgi:hypothetical protein
MAEKPISISAAAKAIGIDRSVLGKQVRAGAVRSGGGKVYLSEVLADRAANIDLSRSKRRDGEIDQPEAAAHEERAPIIVDGEAIDYARARALKESYIAQLRGLELATKRGDLAPVAVMIAAVERDYATVRERFLAIPGKLSGELEADQVSRLTREIHEALEDLSDPRNVIDGADVFLDEIGDDADDTEAAAASRPDRMGRTVPVCRKQDQRSPRKVAHQRATDRVRPDAGNH